MADKVKVYGKSMKWTAMGIIGAYVKMYPQATLDDLNKAFPRNKILGSEGILLDTIENLQKKAASTTNTDFDDVVIREAIDKEWFVILNDGTRVCFDNVMWTKGNFPKMVEHGKLYDIVIADFQEAEKGFGKRGSYTLEYLNGYVPPVAKKKRSLAWLWILLILILIAIIVILLMRSCKEPQVIVQEKVVTDTVVQEKIITDTVVVRDTVFLQQIEEIEKNFNAAEFVQGKADLSESAKFVLHDLAKVMQKNPQLRLRLEGHTSAEGNAASNQKLSEARAQAAVDFLVNHEGIDASRLEAVGKGSTELKNTADPRASENRRTEFIVLE